MEITKETTMGEMLAYDEKIAYILMQEGMHCIGCPSSIGESLPLMQMDGQHLSEHRKNGPSMQSQNYE